MTVQELNRINYLNVIAMIVSAAVAIVIPFELLLLSYAILGPAHYLTEISWLNAKQFFTLKKYDYLLIVAVIVICLLLKLPYANVIFYTFGLSLILLYAHGNFSRIAAFVILVASGYFLLGNNLLSTIFGLYIPTLIHVYLFTGAFLLLGALKEHLVSGYVSFITFLLCPVLLCTLFTGYHINPTEWAIHNYVHFSRLNAISLRNLHLNVFTDSASIIFTRCVAFAYTYHYINWFSKTRVIKWHRITVLRIIVISVIWVASLVLYFYNYRLGLRWLFMLSLIHVILEFPLNQRSFSGIGKELKFRFTTKLSG